MNKSTNKYNKNYIIQKMKEYIKSRQKFSHIKDLCVKNDWSYKYFMGKCIPKYIEEEKLLPEEERVLTMLYEKIRNKQEALLLSVCSKSVSGAIFQLKSDYGYTDNKDIKNNKEAIALIKKRNREIKKAIEKEQL